MTCALCRPRIAEGVRLSVLSLGSLLYEDPPKCAFVRENFSDENWNCGTMNALRGLASVCSWSDDQNAALLPMRDESGRFLLLGWYKNRGRTELARIVGEYDVEPLTLTEAERFLSRVRHKGCPIRSHADDCDCGGAGGDR
jgi:hypothetical protein